MVCTYKAHIPSDLMHMTLTIITAAMSGHHNLKDTHGKQRKSYRYPFTTPESRETLIVDKMPCEENALGRLDPQILWLRGENALLHHSVTYLDKKQ